MARDYQSLSKRFLEVSSNLDTSTLVLIADCLLTIYSYEDSIGCLSDATNKLQMENLELKARIETLEKTKEEP